ncbi:MAG: adenosylcobinamide-GDP ribazoletransferase [Desulfococcaceae bacterium]
MNALRCAIQFLTIFPAGKPARFDPAGMAPMFPLVGLIVGGFLALADWAALGLWSPGAVAMVDVALLAWITGALHLDGLGDTADGLYGNRPRERALEIMKDSRVGAMGVVALILGMGVKWAGIAGMTDHRFLLLFLIPSLARGGMLFGFRFLEYGRPDGGTGQAFFEKKLAWTGFWTMLFPVALSLATGWRGVAILGVFAVTTATLLRFYRRKIGCVTGDMLGAMTEIIEASLFLTASAMVG